MLLLRNKINYLESIFKTQFYLEIRVLSPVVQSIIILMSSLRGQLVKCFMHCKSFSHFSSKKYWHFSDISI